MKEYPSIEKCKTAPNVNAYVFTKYDGSNLRFEWSRKRGWYKYGTRHRLFDAHDIVFGKAIELFSQTFENTLEKQILKKWPKAQNFMAFCEFFGPNSFAGKHIDDEPKELRLFDVNIHKVGMMDATTFIDTFGEHANVAKCWGQHYIDDDYVESIRNADWIFAPESKQYEGVICKWGSGHQQQMMKIKTRRYLTDLKSRFGEDWQKYD